MRQGPEMTPQLTRLPRGSSGCDRDGGSATYRSQEEWRVSRTWVCAIYALNTCATCLMCATCLVPRSVRSRGKPAVHILVHSDDPLLASPDEQSRHRLLTAQQSLYAYRRRDSVARRLARSESCRRVPARPRAGAIEPPPPDDRPPRRGYRLNSSLHGRARERSVFRAWLDLAWLIIFPL